MSIFSKRVPSSQNFHGAWIGAKKQCWKCSGVDFFIFRPGGSFAVLGARLKKTIWSFFLETNLLFQTLLFDQSLPGAHQGGVFTCTSKVFFLKSANFSPNGDVKVTSPGRFPPKCAISGLSRGGWAGGLNNCQSTS